MLHRWPPSYLCRRRPNLCYRCCCPSRSCPNPCHRCSFHFQSFPERNHYRSSRSCPTRSRRLNFASRCCCLSRCYLIRRPSSYPIGCPYRRVMMSRCRDVNSRPTSLRTRLIQLIFSCVSPCLNEPPIQFPAHRGVLQWGFAPVIGRLRNRAWRRVLLAITSEARVVCPIGNNL